MLRFSDNEQVRKLSRFDGADLLVPPQGPGWIDGDHFDEELIEGDLGIIPSLGSLARNAETWNEISISTQEPRIAQSDVSDLEFIEEIARATGAPVRP